MTGLGIANVIIWTLFAAVTICFAIMYLSGCCGGGPWEGGNAGAVKGRTCVADGHCGAQGRCDENGRCVCDKGWSGPFCDIPEAMIEDSQQQQQVQDVPVKCTVDADCTGSSQTCQDTKAEDNVLNLEGRYCMSAVKPNIDCDSRCGGNWVWNGWSGVEGMGWGCRADYPGFPQGNCKDVAADMCPDFTYPQDGSLPANSLKCKCGGQACVSSTDCRNGASCRPRRARSRSAG